MELKPCPFCGGEIRIVRLHGSYGEPWYARCDRCEVSGYYYRTEDQAIEEWSVRPERTCHNLGGVDEFGNKVFNCSKCGCVVYLYDPDGMNNICTSRVVDTVYFCPECGARVVEEVDADGQG